MSSEQNSDDLSITFGVEEELFLIDPRSRDLLADPDPAIFSACEEQSAPHKVVRELLRSQIETNTSVCTSTQAVREAVCEVRRTVIEIAQAHGASVIASSTHPFARWRSQMPTPKERYEQFSLVYQETLRRFMIGGMHIHAGFADHHTRVQIMTALRRYLPVLHALSTSSPFSAGEETGFKSARLNIMSALPRTGIPRAFDSAEDFETLVRNLQRLRFIENASELWWDIRPSNSYPTIEMRICDVCTDIDDLMCLVAIYGSLIRRLCRQARDGGLPDEPLTELISENRWHAQRYGVFANLGDPEDGTRTDMAELVEVLIGELDGDARSLGCHDDLQHAREIIRNGSAADRQVDHFRLCMHEGATRDEAIVSVVDRIAEETRRGIGLVNASD